MKNLTPVLVSALLRSLRLLLQKTKGEAEHTMLWWTHFSDTSDKLKERTQKDNRMVRMLRTRSNCRKSTELEWMKLAFISMFSQKKIFNYATSWLKWLTSWTMVAVWRRNFLQKVEVVNCFQQRHEAMTSASIVFTDRARCLDLQGASAWRCVMLLVATKQVRGDVWLLLQGCKILKISAI